MLLVGKQNARGARRALVLTLLERGISSRYRVVVITIALKTHDIMTIYIRELRTFRSIIGKVGREDSSKTA